MTKKINEQASMNISMSADNATEVGDLLNILKNAGMQDAEPVSNMPMYKGDAHGHDDMVAKMRMMDEPGPEESPCGMEEDEVEEGEYTNSPEEVYGTSDQQLVDLARDSGVNAPKKMYKPAAGGDNPMSEDNIRERLWAALQEKTTTEGRGKKKKSRGAMEGSRGKASRGKKSRG